MWTHTRITSVRCRMVWRMPGQPMRPAELPPTSPLGPASSASATTRISATPNQIPSARCDTGGPKELTEHANPGVADRGTGLHCRFRDEKVAGGFEDTGKGSYLGL